APRRGGDRAPAHRCGPVGVRLAVLDQDLDRVGGAADLQAVLERRADALEDEVVGLAEAGQGTGLGADVAELDHRSLRSPATGPAAALLVVLAGGEQARERDGGAGGAGQAQEPAPVEPSGPEQVVERGMHRLVGHGYLLVGIPADGHCAAVAPPGGRPAWAVPSRARSSSVPAGRGRPVTWAAQSSAARSRSARARPRTASEAGTPSRRARAKEPLGGGERTGGGGRRRRAQPPPWPPPPARPG